MALKVLYGPPCSGKSTYAQEHRGAHDVAFDYDRISAALTYEDPHTVNDRSYAHRFTMACRGAVVSVAREGDHAADNVWLLLTNLTDKAKWAEVIHRWFSDNEEEEERMATPDKKLKLKDQAQARAALVFSLIEGDPQRIESTHYVEGYAARYEPYVLWEDEDGPVYERFEPGCFAGADMSDIILQYDHAGRVFARTGNGSLQVDVDDTGLRMAADLSRTEGGRQLYEDIKAGMITKMSWRFTPGTYDYDPETRTICHHTIKKVWDVSAVSIPANDNTEINARSFGDGLIAEAARREAELDERRRRLQLKIKLTERG